MALRAPSPKRTTLDLVDDETDIDSVRVELAGSLKGYHVILDAGKLTLGFFEDIAGGTISLTIAPVIVGGDLPHGIDRDGIRALTLVQTRALMAGVLSILDISKS